VTARSRPWLLGILVVIFLVVSAVYAFYLYEHEMIQALVLEQVERQLGRKIEVSRADLSIFPRIHLELTDVLIRDVDPSRVFFQAKRFDVILRSTPLLQMKVVVKHLSIEEPRVALHRDTGGRWNFQTGVGADAEGGANPLGLLLLIEETALANGEVTIHDQFRPDGDRFIRLNAVDAAVKAGSKRKSADVRLSATTAGGHGVSYVMIAGKLTHLGATGQVKPQGAPAPSFQFDGMAEALNLDIRQVSEYFGPRPVPDRVQGSANVRGKIRLAPGLVGYDLVLSEMKADIGHLSVKGQASLSGMAGGQPTFSITLSATPVSLDDFLNRFPIHWVDPELHKVLDEHEIRGVVEVATATIAGTAAPDLRVSVTAEFRVQQGHAVVGKDKTVIENLSGTVFVEPDRVRVTGITGLYGAMRISGGKATVSFLEPGPWLDLEVIGEMGAVKLVSLLAETVGTAKASKTLAELRKVQGNALVTFHLAGALRDPDGLKFINGEFTARNVAFQSPQLPDPVEELNGRVVFSKKGVELDGITGRLGRSKFEMAGAITTGDVSAFQGFTVKAVVEASQVVRLLPQGTLAPDALQGMIEAALSLSGPTETPSITSAWDFKDAAINFPGVLQKPANSPAVLQVDGGLGRHNRITISRFELQLPPVRLSGKGRIQLGDRVSVDAALVSGPIPLAALPKGLSFGGVEAGTLEVSLDVKGRGKDWKAWSLTGWVALTDGRLRPKGLDVPVTDIYLRLKLVRNGADVKRLAFRLKDSDVRLSGTVRNWNQTPTITVDVESGQLDIDLLIPKGERSPVRDALENLAATSHVTATVTVLEGHYESLQLSGLSSVVTISDGALDVDHFKAQAGDGRLGGRLLVHLPKAKPADAVVSFQIENLPFEKILALSGDTDRLVTGHLSASGTVQGNGHDPKGVKHSLNGKVEALIKDGHIYRGGVVLKIVTILNLPTLLKGKVDLSKDGFPFDKQSGTFSIKNGLVTSQNIVVDSPIMKMSAAGSYNLESDQLDFVVATSPLGSYSEFVQSIPLFGKLFAGERRGIDTALFEVKGSLKDAEVKYMPLQSFATGLTGLAHLAFDVLKNTVTLPKELIAPGEKPSAPALPKEPASDAPKPEPPAQPAPAIPETQRPPDQPAPAAP
jgi:uncharacterized protein involved in outer membrane biogenesis